VEGANGRSAVTVAAILLAAGASRRMGEPKPLLAWGARTLIEWEIDQLMSSCVDDIVVVAGRRCEDVRRTLGTGSRWVVFNPRWPQGRSTSVVAGARALLASARDIPSAVVVLNVDQPALPPVIDRLVDELRAHECAAVQPSYREIDGREHGGHPIVIAGGLLPELTQVNEATLGLRAVLERHPPRRVPMQDEPCVRLDLDTPDDLAEARRIFGVGG
jgi:molybdenum cofactor cytidylyltransferase